MGVGLNVVQDIISAHGGRITLSNQAEVGAKVTLELPVTSDPAAGAAPASR